MRAIAIIVVSLALAGDANAQTSSQWSQLVAYVGKLANRMLEQQIEIDRLEAENAAQKATINQMIAALDQERCRVTRLNSTVQGLLKSPAEIPTWVEGVACSDLKSPVPPFPAPLP